MEILLLCNIHQKKMTILEHLWIHLSSSVFICIQCKEARTHSSVRLMCSNNRNIFHPIIQSHPLLYMMRASVQAGCQALCRLQWSRRWRCCYVGWPAVETQDLQGWDFLLDTPLQLDTETAVNQSHWSCEDCPFCECSSVCVVGVQQMEKKPFTVHIKEKIFYFNKWILYRQVKRQQ